ncbi:SH3 domain-containing protein [Tateyamaria sp. SN6-1]|uniref:SH3 domain-containing protein n=1 Tax=Tateyamaria sp. SN6-1 TaxID=3092148 RepID=UPI0039F4490B
MTRFIIISFAFLAFAFYELSGGADFDAEETRLARIDPPSDVQETVIETTVADASVAAPIETPLPEDVTRVALNLESVEDVLRPAPTLRTKPAVQRASATPDDAVSEEEPTIILPSLLVDRPVITPVDFNADTTTETAGVTGDTRQLRSVTGRSVNVRGGPGTDYSVVNRLVRGDQVEILQDPGNGWVKLRPVSGGTVGWMADFLLSEG